MTAVNPSARFLMSMAVSPVALAMYPRIRDVAPWSLSGRVGSPSGRAPPSFSGDPAGLDVWAVLRHRDEE